LVNVNDSINKKRSFFTSTMVVRFQYKVIDYVNIDHHNYSSVEEFINELGNKGFELIEVIDMGENNTNKDGKSSRFRYIFKKNG
jgi:endo-alpha-1,4-polygalactosaminidase (GH114 family)